VADKTRSDKCGEPGGCYRARVPSRSGSRAVVAEDGMRLDLLPLSPSSHQLLQLEDRLARMQMCDRPAHPAAVPRRLTNPVMGSVTANGLRHLETNRPQLQHDPAVDVHRVLYPLRLSVVESHHLTGSDVTGRRVLYQHRPT
jgi:hypothetical protein